MFLGKKRRAKAQSGFSLVDICAAMGVLAIALLAYFMQLATDMQLVQTDRETSIAMNAARERVEQIRDYGTFEQTFAAYNSTTADDPVGSPGSGFAVTGLDAQTGDADGLPGRVRFPEDPDNNQVLKESIQDAMLGCPCDMDRDGDTLDTFTGAAPTYRVLPVAVVVEWRGAGGRNRSVELRSMVVKR